MTSLPAILQHAAPYLHEYGIWAVFIGLLLETFGLPMPSTWGVSAVVACYCAMEPESALRAGA
ncbi:MAG: hypothetical protein P8011_19725 [Acidihalobacter sp.]